MTGNSLSACELCDLEDESLSRCKLCNSLVCSHCISREIALCDVCKEAKCTICGEYLSSRACNRCGKLVCTDCGSRVNEVTICIECQAK